MQVKKKKKKDKIAPGEGIQREHRGITEKKVEQKALMQDLSLGIKASISMSTSKQNVYST